MKNTRLTNLKVELFIPFDWTFQFLPESAGKVDGEGRKLIGPLMRRRASWFGSIEYRKASESELRSNKLG